MNLTQCPCQVGLHLSEVAGGGYVFAANQDVVPT